MWFVFALLSAIFAALTSILAKIGIEGVNSNLATAIRTVVVVVMAWGMVFLTNVQSGISQISKKGNGFSYKCAEWDFPDQQKELDIFDLIRSGNRSLLALLLPGITDRRSL